MTRLATLQTALTARTDSSGKPLKGYRKNVVALKAEILRLCNHTKLVADYAKHGAAKVVIAPGAVPVTVESLPPVDIGSVAGVDSTPEPKPFFHRS